MNGKFWEGKRVLITGHTGFKGSWLSLWLQAKGANTIGYALPPPTKTSLFEVANVNKEMVSIIGDIRDLKKFQTVITEHRPEIIIHLAAKPLVRFSYNNPLETYSTNIMGTINVLEAVRQSNSVKVAVIITSDKCYENREWLWGYREDEAMGGHDPYSSSKGCAELVASAYRRSYFSDNNSTGHETHMATTRAGNVIGGGDWAEDRLIPDIMKALMENRLLTYVTHMSSDPGSTYLSLCAGTLSLLKSYGITERILLMRGTLGLMMKIPNQLHGWLTV